MDSVRTWAFTVCASMAVCGLAMQIMPRSNLSGVLKLVISVFFLCGLLMPIAIQLPRQSYELEAYSAREASERAERLTALAENQMLLEAGGSLEKNTADKLRQMGINYHSVTINISVNGQSGENAVALIRLDKAHESEHEKLSKSLESELGMAVALEYS